MYKELILEFEKLKCWIKKQLETVCNCDLQRVTDNGNKTTNRIKVNAINIASEDKDVTQNATIYQEQIEDPLIEGTIKNDYTHITRDNNSAIHGLWYGKEIIMESNINTPYDGVVGFSIQTTKLGTGNIISFNNSKFKLSILSGEDVISSVNGIDLELNVNSQTSIDFLNALKLNIGLFQGIFNNSIDIIPIKIVFSNENLINGTLNINSDINYLHLIGSNIELKNYLQNKGYKLRFFKNDTTAESDTNGIINFLGTIVEQENATEKVLINKEYFEDKSKIEITDSNGTLQFEISTNKALSFNNNDFVFASDVISLKQTENTGWINLILPNDWSANVARYKVRGDTIQFHFNQLQVSSAVNVNLGIPSEYLPDYIALLSGYVISNRANIVQMKIFTTGVINLIQGNIYPNEALEIYGEYKIKN